jgi:hypothetical protein
MTQHSTEAVTGEVLPPLHPVRQEERSFAANPEAELSARQWRHWIETSKGGNAKPFRRQAMMDVLCGAALTSARRGSPRYRPLWTDEALHRAACMLQLLLLLEERLDGRDTQLSLRGELALAKKLHEHFRTLAIHPDHVSLPCEAVLGSVTTLITELFSPAVGHLSFALAGAGLQLPAYRRRALTLTAANLVMQTMLFAFHGSIRGEIHATMDVAGGKARLLVRHDGCYGENVHRSKGFYVVRALADLLDGRLSTRASQAGGAVELRFYV